MAVQLPEIQISAGSLPGSLAGSVVRVWKLAGGCRIPASVYGLATVEVVPAPVHLDCLVVLTDQRIELVLLVMNWLQCWLPGLLKQ